MTGAHHNPDFPWMPDHVAALKRMYADGLSCSEIARALSFGQYVPTRNAVIGKVKRLGIGRPFTKALQKASAPKRSNFKAVCVSAVTARRDELADVKAGRRKPSAVAVPMATPPTASAPKTIIDIRPGECRWIVGDFAPGDGFHALMCACRATRGPYCEAHGARSFVAVPTPRERLQAARKFERGAA